MAFNSFGQPTQTLCQQDFVLVTGTLVNTPIGGTIAGVNGQNFNPQTSQIVGIKGKVLGTVAVFKPVNITMGTQTAVSTTAGQGLITLVSGDTTDTSTYTVFWVNSTYAGLSPC